MSAPERGKPRTTSSAAARPGAPVRRPASSGAAASHSKPDANYQDKMKEAAELVTRVRQRLQQRRLPSFGRVDVTASNGTVRIVGHVPSETEKDLIVKEAHSVHGVSRVIPELTIGSGGKASTSYDSDDVEGWRKYVLTPWAWVPVAGIVGFTAGWFLHGPSEPPAPVAAVVKAPVQPAFSAEDAAMGIKPPAPENATPTAAPAPPAAAATVAAVEAPPVAATGPVAAVVKSNSTELVGQILVSGEPAQGAYLTFVPQQPGAAEPLFFNVNKADGTFAIPRSKLPSGGPVEFAVTVQWFRVIGTGEDSQPGPNALSESYAKPATTPLRLTFDSTTAALAPINIEGK